MDLDLDAVQDRFFQGPETQDEVKDRPDDLCSLSELSEDTLLKNLQRRFAEGIIYTYVGTILVSVNPFKYLPIYNPKFGELYRGRRLDDPSLRPHVFAIADDSFTSMVRNKKNQCIVISGESGSGKTEATKLLLHHVMQVSAKVPTSEELRRILGTAPVLEAFGNAKTVSNNNSSRFGKFVILNFRSNGSYQGASIEKYLLEKSRLIQQSQMERNYHIFYLLLAGADKKLRTRFFLSTDTTKYQILSGTEDPAGKCYTVPDVDDAKEFEALNENMRVFFTPNQIQQVFQLIATLLNLGNIGFTDDESGEGSVVNTNDSLRVVSNLLRVHRETLGVALVTKKTVIRGQEFSCRFNVQEAEDNKWAMGKCLYEALFDWIVAKLNNKLGNSHTKTKDTVSIGILDIFGFEDFQRNSFEQFCINYANEQLQQYFIKHIFQLEQTEYEREGINWSSVQYVDNHACLELLTKRPTGLFHLIDEESRLAQGNDKSLFEKCSHTHKSHSCFEVPHQRGVFIVQHYAGHVTYTVDGFRDKNRDLMRQDIIHVLQNSRTPFIRELIFKESSALRRWRKAFDIISSIQYWKLISASEEDVQDDDTNQLCPIDLRKKRKSWHLHKRASVDMAQVAKIQKPAPEKETAKKSNKSPTVGGQFMTSLNVLMESLGQSSPYFVRCIKSNPTQQPLAFDEKKIITQLRYCGMLETVRIRQLGYNIRMPIGEFLDLFGILVPSSAIGNTQQLVEALLEDRAISKDQAQVGSCKVFMKSYIERNLQTAVQARLTHVAVVIQRCFRRFLARQRKAPYEHGMVSRQSICSESDLILGTNQETSASALTDISLDMDELDELDDDLPAALPASPRSASSHHYEQFTPAKAMQRSMSHHGFGKLDASKSMQDIASADSDSAVQTEESPTSPPEDTPPTLGDEIPSSPSASAPSRNFERAKSMVGLRSQSDTRLFKPASKAKPVPIPKKRTSLAQEPERPSSLTTDSSPSRQPKPPAKYRGASSGKRTISEPPSPMLVEERELESSEASTKKSDELDVLTEDQPEQAAEKSETSSAQEPMSPPGDRPCSPPAQPVSPPKQPIPPAHETPRVPAAEEPKTAPESKTAPQPKTSPQEPKEVPKAQTKAEPSTPVKEEKKEIPPDFYHKLTSASKKSLMCGYCGKQLGSQVKKSVTCTACNTNYHPDCMPLDGICNKSEHSGQKRIIIASLGDCDRFGTCLVSRLARLKTMKKLSRDDRLFRDTLKEYHSGFILQFSVGVKTGAASGWNKFSLSRQLLEDNFEILMTALLPSHSKANFVLCKKTFAQLLDDFEAAGNSSHSSSGSLYDLAPMSSKSRKEESNKSSRDRKEEKMIEHNGHRFQMENFTVPTTCEQCKKTLMAMEEGAVCQVCKTTVHPLCIKKIKSDCKHKGESLGQWNGDIYGATLTQMYTVTKLHIPTVLEMIFNEIENRGLFTPGLYRKGTSPAALKRLRHMLSSSRNGMNMDLSSFDAHVMGAAVKGFLRELKEATIPEHMYKSFVESARAEESERKKLVLELIPSLPPANQFFLERLSFHLARVAQNESANNMNANNLAIIFAPIVIVPPRSMGAMEALQQVSLQSAVMETFIGATLSRLVSAVSEITEIETEKAVIQQTIEEHIKKEASKPNSLVASRASSPPPEPAVAPAKDDTDDIKKTQAPAHSRLPRLSGPPQIDLSALEAIGADSVIKNLQKKMAMLESQKKNLTSNVQSLDIDDGDEDKPAATPIGLKAGFQLPMMGVPPKLRQKAPVASPLAQPGARPIPRPPQKKATTKAGKAGGLDVPATEDDFGPAPVLTHVNKGRPRGAGGRRPPTRAHRQAVAAEAEADAEAQ
ncbi:unconventional myosin-IXb-like isoform X3 [Sycon ciliatum]|uniref:unconventional myosin-IXb-like isoform X3 n=1 Tax=Sycon ciliatum TaxID=27933 RepID=UPI0031F71C93